MKALIRRVFTRGTFAANVATLGAGSFVGQIATILASPILSRLFLPEAFGELQYLLSLGLILGAISTLRYEMAIPLASHRSDAKQLLVLSSGLAVILALIVSIILLVSPDSLTHFRGSLTTPVLIYFLPLLLLMEAHNSIFSYWFTRTKNYKIPSLAKTLFGGGTALGQLGLAVSGFISGLGLILGYLLGQGASLVSFLIAFFRERPEQHEERVSFSGILRQARLHIKFPLFSSWNVVLNTVARNMPPLLLVSYFGMAEAGFYAIGIRLLNMPCPQPVALPHSWCLFISCASSPAPSALSLLSLANSILAFFGRLPIRWELLPVSILPEECIILNTVSKCTAGWGLPCS